MPEPITLTAVGILALTEGVKFLYAQANEFLAQWRRRKEASATPETKPASTMSVPPEVFNGPLTLDNADLSLLDKVGNNILAAKKELANVVDGSSDADLTDEAFLRNVQVLRLSMEEVLGQRITFIGEDRAPAGTPVVRGEVDVELLEASKAIGTQIDEMKQGIAEGKARVGTATDHSEVIGIKVGKVGTSGRPTKS
jgi:hypothetical protein